LGQWLKANASRRVVSDAEYPYYEITDSDLILDDTDSSLFDDDALVGDLTDEELIDELLLTEQEALILAEDGYDVEALLAAEDQDGLTEEEIEAIFEEEFGTGKEAGYYRLRIGDRIAISIYGEDQTGRVVLVDQTGSIDYLIVGNIYVLGMTIPELREVLNEKIGLYFKHAYVNITPVQFGSEYYTVLGQVRGPGKKLIFGETRILDAIAASGGFSTGAFRTQTVELADLAHSFVARNGEYVPVDFEQLVMRGDMRENIELYSGDYIFIPNSLYKEIHVLGEVKSPTTFGHINTVSLVEAILQARGITERASSRAVVIRGSLSNPKKFLIDINLIFRGIEPDFILQPGDIVYVPPRQFTNLRDILRDAVRVFVNGLTIGTGSSAFGATHPHARGENLITPGLSILP